MLKFTQGGNYVVSEISCSANRSRSGLQWGSVMLHGQRRTERSRNLGQQQDRAPGLDLKMGLSY